MQELTDQGVRKKALDLTKHTLVKAPAGSGKTGLLTLRALSALTVVQHPEQVVALTFTNKAANEMRNRICEALSMAAREPRPQNDHLTLTWDLAHKVLERDALLNWGLLKNPARLRVMTIDRLNSTLASQMPVLSGLGGSMAVTDDPKGLYEQACIDLFSTINSDDADDSVRTSLQRVLEYADNRYDLLFPYLIELLARREQWLPYTVAAGDSGVVGLMGGALKTLATDLLERVSNGLGSDADAIAQACAQCDPPNELLSGCDAWPGLDDFDASRAIAGVLVTKRGTLRKRVTAREGYKAGSPSAAILNDAIDRIADSDDAGETTTALALLATAPPHDVNCLDTEFLEALAETLTMLSAQLRVVFMGAGEVDFTEVAVRARVALQDDRGATDVMQRLDYSISHLLVDEMQDTSAGQMMLLEALVSGWEPGDGRSLFMVGDPQQSIYGFRQAEVRLFMQMWAEQAFSDMPLETLTLTSNFRSTPALVAWVNETMRPAFGQSGSGGSEAVSYSDSFAAAADVVESSGVACHVGQGWTKDEEMTELAARVKQVADSDAAASIAVLARSRSILRCAVEKLQDIGVTCASQDVDALSQRPAVADVVALARALWHDMDRLAWVRLVRSPLVGLSWADLTACCASQGRAALRGSMRRALDGGLLSDDGKARIRRVLAVIDGAMRRDSLRGDWVSLTKAVWLQLGGAETVTTHEAGEVSRIFGLMREVAPNGVLSRVEDLERALERLYAAPTPGQVQVMTIHKSKGLEFDHVFIAGIGEGGRTESKPLLRNANVRGGFLLAGKPHRADDPESPDARLYDRLHGDHKLAAKSELVRQVYVAVTRAKCQLHLFGRAGADGKIASGSYLEILRSGITLTQVDSEQPKDSAVDAKTPLTPRLPLDTGYKKASAEAQFTPSSDVRYAPSEAALHGASIDDRHSNILSRLVGTMYHAAFEKILNDGPAPWTIPFSTDRANSFRAGFRRMGLPEPLVEIGLEQVEALVQSTLDGEQGKQLIACSDERRVEHAMSGFIDGAWISGEIDLTYVANDIVYVTDHKSAGLDVPEDERAEFVASQVSEYKPQLDRYERLLVEAGETRRIVKQLYLPALDALATVRD